MVDPQQGEVWLVDPGIGGKDQTVPTIGSHIDAIRHNPGSFTLTLRLGSDLAPKRYNYSG